MSTTGAESLALTYWPHSHLYSPGDGWPPWLQERTVAFCHPPRSTGPSLQSYFPSAHPHQPAALQPGVIPSQKQDFPIHQVPVSPFLGLAKVSLNSSPAFQYTPTNVQSPTNLLRVHFIPSSRSLMKTLNSTGPSTDLRGALP